MSLSLARVWVTSTIRQPQAKSDALRLLDQAANENVDATLIVGAELSIMGRCYLGRWDGQELTVIELAEEQQRDWKINRLGLFSQLEPARGDVPAPSAEPLVSLSILSVEGAGDQDGWQPLSGSCLAELDEVALRPIGHCALRAEYFRPDLARSVTSYWYLNSPLVARRTELKFRLPPFFSHNNPQSCRGALLVFLQLVSAENWQASTECRRVSNVAAVSIHRDAPGRHRVSCPHDTVNASSYHSPHGFDVWPKANMQSSCQVFAPPAVGVLQFRAAG